MNSIRNRIVLLERKSISVSVLYLWRYDEENLESCLNRNGLSANSLITKRIFLVSWISERTTNQH